MDSRDAVAKALQFSTVKKNEERDQASQKQIREFIERYPYKEKQDLLRTITPDILFESSANDRFFNWLQDRTSNIGTIPPLKPAVFAEAVKRIDFFKVILTVLVSDKKSISSKIDQNWGVIPGFGGEKEIAKKLLSIYYSDFVIPIYKTEELEQLCSNLGIDYMNQSIQHFRKDYSVLTVGQKFELLNLGLMEFKKANLKDWSNTLYADFLRSGVLGSASGQKSSPSGSITAPQRAAIETELTKTTQLYEARLRVSDKTIRELRSQLSSRDERAGKLQADLESREKELAQLREEIDRKEKAAGEELGRLKESISKASTESSRKVELEEQLKMLSGQLEERDAKIRMMEGDIEKMKASLHQSGAQAEDREKLQQAIKQLNEQAKEREEKIRSLEEQASREDHFVRIGESDFVGGDIGTFEAADTAADEQEKVKSGTPRMDDLLNGGIPVGSQIVVYGPSFIGKDVFLDAFAAEGLNEGLPLIWVTTDKTIDEIREEMSRFVPNYQDFERRRLIFYVDAYSRMVGDNSVVENAAYLEENAEVEDIGYLVDELLAKVGDKARERGYRLVFRSISSLSANRDIKSIFALLRQFVARRRKDRCVTTYSIEKGIMSEQDLQIISSIMDGVIEFTTDGRNNFIAVQGICETQTRDKVEYLAGKNELSIGSFFLGRIK